MACYARALRTVRRLLAAANSPGPARVARGLLGTALGAAGRRIQSDDPAGTSLGQNRPDGQVPGNPSRILLCSPSVSVSRPWRLLEELDGGWRSSPPPARRRRRPTCSTTAAPLLFFFPTSFLFLCPLRPRPVVSVEATPATRHGSGRRQCSLPPKGTFPFRPWWRQAPPLPMFFDRCLGMPMPVGSRGTARLETAALLCRRARGLSR
jgi:hypothetical protein